MNPDDILACLAHHHIAFDGEVTTTQIQSHLRTRREPHVVHLLAELDRQAYVRHRCGEAPIIATQPYP